jgi:hypothetical protein
MADQSLIDAVKVQLPNEAAALGINDGAIGNLLDRPLTLTHAILESYRAIAAKTMMMTDISESGSTRNMSVLNQNARAMIDYWQKVADKEDLNSETEQISRFRSHRATRV